MKKTIKNRLDQIADLAPQAVAGWVHLPRAYQLGMAVFAMVCLAGLFTTAPREQVSPLSDRFFVTLTEDPSHLSEADIAQYKIAFAAIANSDYATADESMKAVHNKRLVGHLQAKKFLRGNYAASADELKEWLALNADHPKAPEISRIAIARGVKTEAIAFEKPLKGEGYADHLGRTGMPDGWYRGLTLWKEQNYGAAEEQFAAIGNNESLNNWHRAGGYYWAYRAASKNGETGIARKHLMAAANFKTTFYGLLAVQQTGSAPAEARAPRVASSLRNDPRAIRASLFAQLNMNEEAEEELRHLYSALDKQDRAGIITLAHELNLANLQVRLANMSQLSAEEELFASYPLPQFVIDAQSEQSPALLLAIARNESGFRESVSSSAGAQGLMQMLPSTASAVERRVGRENLMLASTDGDALPSIMHRLNDPATSVRYSAQYLKILSAEKNVGKNLVRVLAAYNAGPGTVSGWSSMAQKMDDPLLYIESIPYAETRNYVMQVMAQYWIYSNLLGETPQSLREMTAGSWPSFNG